MKTKRNLIIIGCLALIFAVGFGIWKKKKPSSIDVAAAPKCTVSRGDILLSLLQTGELDAKRNVIIKNDMDREAKIVNIVDDGSYVKKGELLVELDCEELQNKFIMQQATVSRAEADVEQAARGLDIDKLKCDTEKATAVVKYDIAKLDLKKYEEAEYNQKLHQAESDVELAKSDVKRATEKYEWSVKLVEKGFISRMEMEANEAEVKQKEALRKSKEEDLIVLSKYTHEKDLLQKNKDVITAAGEVERIVKTYENDRTRNTALLESKKASLTAERNTLKKIETQVASSKVIADFEGLVFYPAPDPWRSDRNIAKGTSVYPRQEILKYPDLSAWIITVGVPEAIIDKVKEGQDAVASFDALPGTILKCTVDKVSIAPDKSRRWMDSDTKNYTVTLDVPTSNTLFTSADGVTSSTVPLKPGMSAQVQIITGRIKDALRAPIQAVTTREGKPTVYVVKGKSVQPTSVETGKNNDEFIEILSGVSEGAELLLYAPIEQEKRAGIGEKPMDKMKNGEGDNLGNGTPQKKKADAKPQQPTAPTKQP